MSNPNAPTVARTTAPAELSAPGLVLLYGSTPNGWKCTYALEILKQAGLVQGYTVCEVYLQKGEQFQPWFKEVNPNSKMPALIDNRPNKKPAYVWESASILRYLERTYDTQKGQLNHFYRYADVKIPLAEKRYRDEVDRLYKVLDAHLEGRQYLVGDKLSYGDITAQPWVRCAFWAAVDLAEYPNVQAWHDRIEQTPVILDALKIPSQDLVTRVKNDPELEARITAAMEKRKAEAKEKEDGAGGSTAE
ncbi:Glutathione S-transferase 2 [Rhodotorula sphaerocarpa]